MLFKGQEIPQPTTVPVGADPQHCGHERSLEDYVIDTDTRGVRYVLLHLEGGSFGAWSNPSHERLILDNTNCRFEPHAAVATVGSVLEVKNSDKVLHTVHAYHGASFNIALPPGGASVERRLTVPGLIQFRCDAHGWMNAFLRVNRHPFHAVTDFRGRFSIDRVPPGRYVLKAWHERFGAKERTVHVQPGSVVEVQLGYED